MIQYEIALYENEPSESWMDMIHSPRFNEKMSLSGIIVGLKSKVGWVVYDFIEFCKSYNQSEVKAFGIKAWQYIRAQDGQLNEWELLMHFAEDRHIGENGLLKPNSKMARDIRHKSLLTLLTNPYVIVDIPSFVKLFLKCYERGQTKEQFDIACSVAMGVIEGFGHYRGVARQLKEFFDNNLDRDPQILLSILGGDESALQEKKLLSHLSVLSDEMRFHFSLYFPIGDEEKLNVVKSHKKKHTEPSDFNRSSI